MKRRHHISHLHLTIADSMCSGPYNQNRDSVHDQHHYRHRSMTPGDELEVTEERFAELSGRKVVKKKEVFAVEYTQERAVGFLTLHSVIVMIGYSAEFWYLINLFLYSLSRQIPHFFHKLKEKFH